jgi:EmrB/QacA subfamily drug resistance transporter
MEAGAGVARRHGRTAAELIEKTIAHTRPCASNAEKLSVAWTEWRHLDTVVSDRWQDVPAAPRPGRAGAHVSDRAVANPDQSTTRPRENDGACAPLAAQVSSAETRPDKTVSLSEFLQIFAAVMLPMFLAAVDQTLLATATPAIAADLGGLRDTTWIALAYLMAATIMVPLYGRLGDRYGRHRLLLIAVGVFALGSAACGAAQSMLQLVFARALQGLGGGGLMVMSQAMIGELVPPRERPRFQGYFAANFTLASLAGPVVGGYVVSHMSWRWLFLANLPLALLATWRILRLPPSAPHPNVAPLTDVRGLILFVAAAVCWLVWLSFAGHRFAWWSATSVVLLASAVVLLLALVHIERRSEAPFLPVELLRIPGAAKMAGTIICFAACFFACIFFLPVYLQLGAGVQAKEAGLLLLPVTLGMVTGATITGRIVARTARPTPLPVFGLSLAALALLGLGLVAPVAPRLAALGFAVGTGFGTVMPCGQLVLQTLAGRARLGAAAATVSLSRSVGAALGTALFGALVFALLHGMDLDTLGARSAADAARIERGFRFGFIAAAAVAAVGAVIAARLPRIRLE